ncbi:TniB family NTP-binding protein [Paraburkholderia sediminicola]|uniref:TniB family NTP-binding protein n=1 Tax=Paraburkholderia sediminicola TaxID=458836 RepID=UPI0038B98D64
MNSTICIDLKSEDDRRDDDSSKSEDNGPNDSKDALVASVRNTLIEHPVFATGITAIRRCHRMGRFGLEEPGCLLITGVSGSGKSTLRKEYAKHYPPRETDEGTEIRVLHLELPAQPTIKNVAERILLDMGDPLFARGSAEAMTERIVTLFKNCGVQLVILDEFQHFIDHSSEKIETKVADWLKYLINITKVPFVLMGLSRCRRILQTNEQLRRRFSRQISLEPFSIRSTRARRVFEVLVHSFWKSLPVPPADGLVGDARVIEAIHFATFGLMGYVTTLTSVAVQIALDEEKTTFDLDLLGRAFVEGIWPDAKETQNPFDRRFVNRPLTLHEEPFFGY